MNTTITMGKLLKEVSGIIYSFHNKGYSSEKERRKNALKRTFLKQLHEKYPSVNPPPLALRLKWEFR